MKVFALSLFFLFSTSVMAASEPAGIDTSYQAAANLDLDTDWLDPNELVKILNYDFKTHAYEILKVEDPTVLRIYTTPNNLTKSVRSLELEALERQPTSIVGRTFELDHELILLP